MADKPTLMELANAMCGDALKACLINHFYPDIRVNPLMVRAPQGDLEKAAAAERAKQLKDDDVPATPAKRAAQLMVAFREDDAKKPQGMFSGQDVDPVTDIQERLKRQQAYNAGRVPAVETPAAPVVPDHKPDLTGLDDGPPDSFGPGRMATHEGIMWFDKEAAAAELQTGKANLDLLLRKAGVQGQTLPGQGRGVFFPVSKIKEIAAERSKKKAA